MKIFLVYLFVLSTYCSSAQSPAKIPLMRRIFHDNIERIQQKIDRIDGKQDHQLNVGSIEGSKHATESLFEDVQAITKSIEGDTLLDSNRKMKFLRGLSDVLITFEIYTRKENGVLPEQITQLVPAYRRSMELERNKQSLTGLIDSLPVEVGEVLLSTLIFSNNLGYAESKDLVRLKRLVVNPGQILPSLQRSPTNAAADSLIKLVAYTNPEQLYSYAQAGDELADIIQNHTDPLVHTIGKLAQLNTGRLYFPFLDNLYRGKITMEEVDLSMEDKYKYFRLLVNTEIDYAGRIRGGDTPVDMSAITSMLKNRAVDGFINVINGLHDSPDAIRMKEVEPLNAQELYYLCVMGDPEIYTSSYLKVYERMFQRLNVPDSDSLLAMVNFDFFKKFIKMAAGYNTLDHFLGKMQKANAQNLMRTFASNLEKTTNLENAVDVADSYASISNPQIRKLILEVIQKSYDELKASDNKRGIAIYDILNSIFESLDPANKIDLSAKFGIPSVYAVKNSSLQNSSGRIIIQQFFYGDKDGFNEFNNFKSAYRGSNWRTVNKAEWIEVSSVKGTPITIYSNKPLNATSDLDAKAQANLSSYLQQKGLKPTVVIHRGHSYYVRFTIQQLAPSSRIVLLGSCGGYHNIGGVLNMAPGAHIIASKQVGSGSINQPMIINLTEDMRQGKSLNWPQKWKHFEKYLSNNEHFDDYIPPHKNLGAIFIMAYKKTFGNQGA